MKSKISTALGALMIGLEFTSAAMAAVNPGMINQVNQVIAQDDAQALLALLEANPELLQISGAFGASLRAFYSSPTEANFNRISAASYSETSQRSGNGFQTASNDGHDDGGSSIY